MIKVVAGEGMSGEKLLKKFTSYVKSRKLPQRFRKLRNFERKLSDRKAKKAAISREAYRKEANKKRFLS